MPMGPNGEPLSYDPATFGQPLGPPPGPPPSPQQQPPDVPSDVRQLVDAIRMFAEANGMTEQERLKVEKISTLLQELAADREKEEQGMLAGKLSPGAMQRAYAGG